MENQHPTSPPLPPPPPLEEPDSKRLKTSTTTSDDKKTRYKRRKVAILFAYCGVGYQGMQKNPGAKTIEGDLEEALYFSGAVPENERGCPNRYDFARSARTDKGVSAVGQVVSGKFYVDPPGFVERLNKNLPAQFRVFGYKRVTASFSAKKFCDRRRYVYLLPVFALDPAAHRESSVAGFESNTELAKCSECSERGWKVFGLMGGGSEVEIQLDILSNTSSALLGSDGKVENLASLDNGNGCIDGLNPEPVKNSSASDKQSDDKPDSEVKIQLGISSNTSCALLDSDGKVENLASLENGSGGDDVLNSEHVIVEVQSLENSSASDKCVDNKCNSEVEIQPGISSNTSRTLSDSDDKVEKLESVDNGNGSNDTLNPEPVIVEVQSLENSSAPDKHSDNKPGANIVKENVYHYDDEKRQRFNKLLKQYEGTHNFHNFTTRTKAADPSANRYIISFHANTTVTVDGVEFVKCEVIGQSFMLHQIRKMIGAAVAIMRNCAPESLIETALQQDVRINVPTAPEVGLYLDECFFSSYNQKWKDTHEEVSMKAYAAEAEEFKLKHIYSHIASTEHKEGAVAVWLHSLNYRNYGPEGNSGANDVPRTQPE